VVHILPQVCSHGSQLFWSTFHPFSPVWRSAFYHWPDMVGLMLRLGFMVRVSNHVSNLQLPTHLHYTRNIRYTNFKFHTDYAYPAVNRLPKNVHRAHHPSRRPVNCPVTNQYVQRRSFPGDDCSSDMRWLIVHWGWVIWLIWTTWVNVWLSVNRSTRVDHQRRDIRWILTSKKQQQQWHGQ